MQANRPRLLLDTNVWHEKYIPNRPCHAAVLNLLAEARSQDVALAFPSQSALDVYQRVCIENKRLARMSGRLTETMAKTIKRFAWDCVDDMRNIATAVPVDSSDLYLVCKHRELHDDLEDDLVLAACKRAHANYLVTLDRKLLAHAPVQAATPEDMLGLLRAGVAQAASGSAESWDWLLEWLGTI